MANITNYTKPADDPYRLVRIRGKQAEILPPEVLAEILDRLELAGRQDLWDALYRSQPYHSTYTDPAGIRWCGDRSFPSWQIPRMFLWAVAAGHLPAA